MSDLWSKPEDLWSSPPGGNPRAEQAERELVALRAAARALNKAAANALAAARGRIPLDEAELQELERSIGAVTLLIGASDD